MRVYILYIIVAAISLYAYRDWFVALCGLILLMAITENPDFPKSISDIPGLNPWNIGLLNVMAGWWIGRRQEGLPRDMPVYFTVLLLLYLLVVLVGWLRCLLDHDYVTAVGYPDIIGERLINTVKWVIPGLLLFDGCRSRSRLKLALACTLGIYFLLAVQVIRWMPFGLDLTGMSLNQRALRVIINSVGYHPVNMSMMLAGACWAVLATLPLFQRRWQQALVVVAALLIAYGQALTGGRMGYVTWGIVGLTMGCLRWRKCLLAVPVIALVISIAVPGTVERMRQGFGERTATDRVITNKYEVTSGRTLIWPFVIDKIGDAPLAGYGRLAMQRTGLADTLWRRLQEEFPHPHNAYFEWVLDNGLIGLLLILPFYAVVLWQSARLFRCSTGPAYVAVGGMCFALVLALLVASIGSQSFYPREGSVGMWAAIGLMLRLSVQRRALTEAQQPFPARAVAARVEGPARRPAIVDTGAVCARESR